VVKEFFVSDDNGVKGKNSTNYFGNLSDDEDVQQQKETNWIVPNTNTSNTNQFYQDLLKANLGVIPQEKMKRLLSKIPSKPVKTPIASFSTTAMDEIYDQLDGIVNRHPVTSGGIEKYLQDILDNLGHSDVNGKALTIKVWINDEIFSKEDKWADFGGINIPNLCSEINTFLTTPCNTEANCDQFVISDVLKPIRDTDMKQQ